MALFRRARSERENVDRVIRLAVRIYADVGISGELVDDPDDPMNACIRTSDAVYGLANAVLACLNAREREWPAILARFASSLNPGAAEKFDRDRDRDALRARLMPRDVSAMTSVSYARPFSDDLVEVLCLDTPETVITLQGKELDGYDFDDLFLEARANLAKELIDSSTLLEEGVVLFEGMSLFIASLVLTPERLRLELGGAPHGFAFIIPDRHTIVAHAVEGASSVPAIQALVRIGSTTSAEHRPGGLLSRHVFFSHNGATDQITFVNQETGALGVLADGPFLEALNLE